MKRRLVPVAMVVVVAVALTTWLGLGSSGRTTTAGAATTTALGSTARSVWPTASQPARYLTPSAAALGFAVHFLHMKAPVVAGIVSKSPSAGTVGVKTSASGPVTQVAVAKAANQAWFVTGATTLNISVSEPKALALVRSPLHISGTGVAFEGVLNVSVRDDTTKPLLSTTVHAGSTAPGGYSATLRFATPRTPGGDLVVFARSAKDGSVAYAAIVRLRF